MENDIDYEKIVRSAYRNSLKAKAYKEQYTRGAKWARFTMWRVRKCVEKGLKRHCYVTKNTRLLDIPCGTGLLLSVFRKLPCIVIGTDISLEMMGLAREEENGKTISGFIQCDIADTPFRKGTFDCVLTLGLMHRVPRDIKRQVLKEVSLLSKKHIMISYSIDCPAQRVKQWVIKRVSPSHIPAPAPDTLQNIFKEFETNKLIVKKIYRYVYFFSAQVLFILEKNEKFA